MHNTLADQINALAARYNCPRKVHGNYNGQIFFFFFLQVDCAEMAEFQDRNNRFSFDL